MGTNRALRGGAWDYEAAGCTVTYRIGGNPATAANNRGFRVVRRP